MTRVNKTHKTRRPSRLLVPLSAKAFWPDGSSLKYDAGAEQADDVDQQKGRDAQHPTDHQEHQKTLQSVQQHKRNCHGDQNRDGTDPAITTDGAPSLRQFRSLESSILVEADQEPGDALVHALLQLG